MDSEQLLQQNQQLKAELEEAKLELLRTQARLHQVQEELEQVHLQSGLQLKAQAQSEDFQAQLQQAEAVIEQLRVQYRHAQYDLLVFKACVAYGEKNWQRMRQYLEQALEGGRLEPQAMLSDWLKQLHQFAQDKELAFDIPILVNSPEWKALMRQVIAS